MIPLRAACQPSEPLPTMKPDTVPTLDQPVKVWDPFVRLFHWSLVSCVLLNQFVLEEGKTRMNGRATLPTPWCWRGWSGASSAAGMRALPTSSPPRRLARHFAALRQGSTRSTRATTRSER